MWSAEQKDLFDLKQINVHEGHSVKSRKAVKEFSLHKLPLPSETLLHLKHV